MSREENDFGFSFVDEKEVIVSANDYVDYKERLNKVWNILSPFLNNLAANPEKEYIKWPNRSEKVAEFKQKMYDLIHNGTE